MLLWTCAVSSARAGHRANSHLSVSGRSTPRDGKCRADAASVVLGSVPIGQEPGRQDGQAASAMTGTHFADGIEVRHDSCVHVAGVRPIDHVLLHARVFPPAHGTRSREGE